MKRLWHCRAHVAVAVLAFAQPLSADLKTLQNQFRAAYVGQNLILRGFIGGGDLRYNSDGSLQKGGPPGAWTTDGIVRILQLSFHKDKLRIDGLRMLKVYGVRPEGSRLLQGSRVRIEADLAAGDINAVEVQNLIRRVFLGRDEPLADNVPSYWKPFLAGRVHPSNKPPPAMPFFLDGANSPFAAGQSIPKAGTAGLSPPVPIKTPDPPYTGEALRARCSGAVDLLLVLGSDGAVKDVVVLKPLGLGLDDAAVRTVYTWKFRPAMRDQHPVAASVATEVTFRISF